MINHKRFIDLQEDTALYGKEVHFHLANFTT